MSSATPAMIGRQQAQPVCACSRSDFGAKGAPLVAVDPAADNIRAPAPTKRLGSPADEDDSRIGEGLQSS